MKKPQATFKGADEDDLFPRTWPWRAWLVFEEGLLVAVYPKSGDLWAALRNGCRDVTSWLRHFEYEGDIGRDDTFSAAIGLIPTWPEAEVKLRQARHLLGRQVWDSLVAKAAAKGGEPPDRPHR